MAFRTNSTNMSEYGGLQVFDSDGVSEVKIETPSLSFVAYLQNPTLSTPNTTVAYVGSFTGGRLGVAVDNNNEWKRNDYQSLGSTSGVQFDRHNNYASRTRHVHEEQYGHLDGKPLAVGCGLVGVWRNVPVRPTEGAYKYGVDLFRYDGSFFKTIDPYDIVSTSLDADTLPGEVAYHFGTSISIGEGRILITNPYQEMSHGSSGVYNSQGVAFLFDLHGNQLSHRWDGRGGTANVQQGGGGYEDRRTLFETDQTTRHTEPNFFFYDPVTTGFGMCSAIGEGRIVITAPFDVKVNEIGGTDYYTNSLIGRGAFHIYDINLNHIRTVWNPDFEDDVTFGNNFNSQTNNVAGFGRSIAIGDGRIIVGAPNRRNPSGTKGKIYCFDIDGNLLWSEANPDHFSYLNGRTDDTGTFGNSVAVGSGRVAVGNYRCNIRTLAEGVFDGYQDTGVMHVYDLDGNHEWESRGGNDINGFQGIYDGKGYSVAISDNVIYQTTKRFPWDDYTGSLRAHNLDDTGSTSRATGVEYDFFGECVAAADGYVAISRPGETVNGYSYAGDVLLYKNANHQPAKKVASWKNYDQKLGGPPLAANLDFTTTRIFKQIKASDYIGVGGTLTINDTDTQNISSNEYVWSDDVNVPALIVDVEDATIINKGKIIGRGGDGADAGGSTGQDGGPAIVIAASGVTIQNNSGAYIAGGGGGGGSSNWGAGGGGAGGGKGGNSNTRHDTMEGGLGGVINSIGGGDVGDDGESWGSPYIDYNYGGSDGGSGDPRGQGGGAGGGGGAAIDTGSSNGQYGGAGGGGGRVLPGSGGTGGDRSGSFRSADPEGGDGGLGGNVGDNGLGTYGGEDGGGGGGGWGAAGGTGAGGGAGGAGGPAIKSYGLTYSLTNNGTIYGSTNDAIPT